MLDIIAEALLDTLKLVPFLFITYLAMEYIEHKTNSKVETAIEKSGKFGPLIGGIVGIIPQCGFSSVAANFYAGKIITAGTLVAIFISTSDEMLPILIAASAPISMIVKILGFKLVIAVIIGFIADRIFRRPPGHDHDTDIHPLCEKEGCHCGEGNIFKSAAKHTLNITIFIFIISMICGLLIFALGVDTISQIFFGVPAAGEFLSALIGLVPNCASSVLITNLYLDGLMPAGPMLSGLIMNSGVGLAVLFKMNGNLKENLKLTGFIYIVSVVAGLLITVAGISL